MINSFATYLLLVSVLFAGGAWATEQALIVRRWPRRFLWLATLLASALFPLGMALSTSPVHTVVRTKPPAQLLFFPVSATEQIQAQGQAPAQATPSSPTARAASRAAAAKSRPVRLSLDRLVSAGWLSSTIVTGLWYLFTSLRLARLVQNAPCRSVEGVPVRITAVGPAVFGFFRPEILWPSWLDEAPPATRAAALAHETQHLAAGDPRALAVGLFLVMLAPWNPVFWWQLRRMRFAMEADCDRRVVRGGTDETMYAGALLQIALARMAGGPGLAVMMSTPSWLEWRVRTLLHSPGRRMVLLAVLGVPLALGAWAAVAQLPSPSLHAGELRKLPPEDIRPGANWARALARSRYPELFDRHFDGTAVVAAIFNSDGTLRLVDQHLYQPGVPPSDLDLQIENERAGVDLLNDVYYAGQERGEFTIGPWLDTVNAGRLFVVYEVLGRAPDPSRSAARVEAALRSYAPELFLPRDPASNTLVYSVTVFMNDDGTVARMSKFIVEFGKSYQAPQPVDSFAAMGIPQERLGRDGRAPGATTAIIDYAWPRRPDDPPDTWGRVGFLPRLPDPPARQDSDDEERIAERYFHDLDASTELADNKREFVTPWVLLGRDGLPWDAGVWHSHLDHVPANDALHEELEDRYPGIRVDMLPGWRNGGLTVTTAWISPDSPIQRKAEVDLHKRQDFLVTGAVVSGVFLPTPVATAADLGVPAELGTGPKRYVNLAGVRYLPTSQQISPWLEVTVTQAGSEGVRMSVRARPLSPRGSWTPAVQAEAPYRTPTAIELPGDTPAQTMRLVLQVERLRQ